MEFEVDLKTSGVEYNDIIDSIKSLLSNFDCLTASFYEADFKITNTDELVIIRGEYEILGTIVKQLISQNEHFNYFDEFDYDNTINYQTMVIHACEHEDEVESD